MTILVKIFLKKNIGILIFFLFLTVLANQLMHLLAQNAEINLLDEQYGWSPYNAATITHDARGLNIVAETAYNTTLYNRAYLPIEISSASNKPIFMDIEYGTTSYLGKAIFFVEVRDNKTNEILWRSFLNDTDRKSTNETLQLPPTLLNKPTEFRFYIRTDSPGLHMLDITKAVLRSSSANATETAINNTDTSVSTVANETANATEAAINNTDTSVSTVANETANATETASNETGNSVLDDLKNIFGGIMGNK